MRECYSNHTEMNVCPFPNLYFPGQESVLSSAAQAPHVLLAPLSILFLNPSLLLLFLESGSAKILFWEIRSHISLGWRMFVFWPLSSKLIPSVLAVLLDAGSLTCFHSLSTKSKRDINWQLFSQLCCFLW